MATEKNAAHPKFYSIPHVPLLLDEGLRYAVKMTGAQAGKILLYANSVLTVASHVDFHHKEDPSYSLQVGQGIAGMCFLTGSPQTSEDLLNDPRVVDRTYLEKCNYRAMVAVPLHVHGAICGVMAMLHKESRSFTKREVDCLSAMASDLSLKMHHYAHHPRHIEQYLEIYRKNAFLPEVLTGRSENPFPKGVSPVTLGKICRHILFRENAARGGPILATNVARGTKVSEVTARAYLAYLANIGALRVDNIIPQGSGGRPRLKYHCANDRQENCLKFLGEAR